MKNITLSVTEILIFKKNNLVKFEQQQETSCWIHWIEKRGSSKLYILMKKFSFIQQKT